MWNLSRVLNNSRGCRCGHRGGRCKAAGFALLEVVVALAILAVSTLVIAESLGAAIAYAGAAEAARRGTAAAAAIADTSTGSADYPVGWRVVGTAGTDRVPGTRDDGPPTEPEPPCQRHVETVDASGHRWLWVEAACNGAAVPGGRRSDAIGGRLARVSTLVRSR